MGINRKYIVFLTLFILQSFCGIHQLYAQDPTLSKNGQFKVNFVKGCTPFTVTVIEDYRLDGFPPSQTRAYRLLDENKNPVSDWVNTGSIVISSPGVFFIEQQVQDRDEDDIIRVEAISTDPVPFTITNCGNQTASVEFIPEENTYTAFALSTSKIGTGTQEGSYTINKNGQDQFIGEIPFQGSGDYSITIKGLLTQATTGATSAGCWNTTFTFSVYDEIPPPELNLLQAFISSGEDSALLSYNLLQDVGYILEYSQNGSGTFNQVREIQGSQVNPTEFISFDFQENFYCFRAKTKNQCNPANAVFSEPFCTAKLQVNPGLTGNQIIFETGTEGILEEAKLLRKAASALNWQQVHSFGATNTGSFLDSLIDCSTTYQYAIELVYTNGSRSRTQGLPVANEADRTLPAPVNVSSNWEGTGSVNFSIAELLNKEDVHLQAFRAGNASRLVDEADTGFIALPAAAENTCYRFQYTDACGNVSAISEPVCAIYLQNISTEPAGLVLQWNAYTGYADGVSYYELVRYDPDGNPLGRTQLGTQTSVDLGPQDMDQSGFWYEIVAYPQDLAIRPSSSNQLLFEIEVKGYFPNVFNPNSKGPNGRFTVLGSFVSQLRLKIFNRWGELVYETTDIENGWDGTINGNPAPPGTYVYRAVVGTSDGQEQTYQGAVFLMRR